MASSARIPVTRRLCATLPAPDGSYKYCEVEGSTIFVALQTVRTRRRACAGQGVRAHRRRALGRTKAVPGTHCRGAATRRTRPYYPRRSVPSGAPTSTRATRATRVGARRCRRRDAPRRRQRGVEHGALEQLLAGECAHCRASNEIVVDRAFPASTIVRISSAFESARRRFADAVIRRSPADSSHV